MECKPDSVARGPDWGLN